MIFGIILYRNIPIARNLYHAWDIRRSTGKRWAQISGPCRL